MALREFISLFTSPVSATEHISVEPRDANLKRERWNLEAAAKNGRRPMSASRLRS